MRQGRGEDEDFGWLTQKAQLARAIFWLYRARRPTRSMEGMKRESPTPDNPAVTFTLDEVCELGRCWLSDVTQTMGDDEAIEFHRDMILHCEKRIAMHEAAKAGVDLPYGEEYP